MGKIIELNGRPTLKVLKGRGILKGYRYKWFRVRVNKNKAAWLADLARGTVDVQAESLRDKIKLLMPTINVDFFDEDSHTRYMIEGDCPGLEQDQVQALCDRISARILKHCYNADFRTPTISKVG